MLFSLFYTCNKLPPILNSPICSCVKKDIIFDNGICSDLNSPPDNDGKKGKNKTGVNISLYTVADFLERNFLASSMMYSQYIIMEIKKKIHAYPASHSFFFFFLIPVSAIT